MLLGLCHGSIWVVDDFSKCFQHDYLQTLLPLGLCCISLAFLVLQLVHKAFHTHASHVYKLLQSPKNIWKPSPLPVEDSPSDDDVSVDVEDIDDEIERNAQLALRPTISQTDRTTTVEVDRPRGETFIVIVEVLAVLAQLVIGALTLAGHAPDSASKIAAIAGFAFWGYIFILVSTRLLLVRAQNTSFPQIWYHTAFLYGLSWLWNVLLFRSYVIHPPSTGSRNLMFAQFSFLSLLTLISLLSRKGNKPVQLEWEGAIEPSQEQTASVLSLATFSWVDAIVWKGYKKTFEMSDVWNIAPNDKAAVILANYRQVKKTSSLAWRLLKFFKTALIVQSCWAVFSGFLTFAPTLLLRAILQYVEAPQDTPRNSAWFFVILLFVSGCGSALADGHALWVGRRTCIRLRAIIIGELYAKALKRKAGASTDKVLGEKSAKKSTKNFLSKLLRRKDKTQDKTTTPTKPVDDPNAQVTSGAVINLMAVDSFKVAEVSAYLHFLWASTPVQLVVCLILLYQVLGFSSLAGVGMIFVLLPLNLFISKSFSKFQTQISAATDARIHVTNEVLTNIRIIKYFAWEQRFISNIDEKRSVELRYLKYRYILWAFASTMWSATPIIITFLSFAIYTIIEKKDLIPSVAFTALSLFQILRLPLDQLADMVAHVQESKVSVNRVEEFLNEEDTEKYQQLRHSNLEQDEILIGFDNATFTWGSKEQDFAESDAFRMMDLDMKFQVGQFNVIAGSTGSGKTSLLMALLGEMTILEGSVYLSSARSREDLRKDPSTGLTESVAYCSQQAWLVNDTIKQNILFASPWNAERYSEVITACSLKKDLQILDEGDNTLVGEKGVTLSGGQKQRISLARALYSNARHILLDDILSAVDSHTAKWIFDHALMGPLMSSRTCILVTHNISLCLPHAQFSVVLENGRVIAQGSAQDVINSGALSEDLTKSANASRAASRIHSAEPSDDESDTDQIEDVNGHVGGTGGAKSKITATDPSNLTHSKGALDEEKATGGVKLEIIILYLKAMGRWYFWVTWSAFFVLSQIASVATNVWIRYWANAYAYKKSGSLNSFNMSSLGSASELSGQFLCYKIGTCTTQSLFVDDRSQTTMTFATEKVNESYYLGVYAILGFLFCIIGLTMQGLLFAGSLNASKTIHERLIEAVSRAKFRFFDSTPLGQIMNRFSKDVENIDQEVAPVAIGVVHCLASIVTIVILISVITPGFLVAGIFITILYTFIGKFYINSSRDLKRLESVQRSPLYQQFGETLSGMITIRAYGDERRFIRENLNRVNTHSRPFFYLWAANRWLAFRVDVAGALVSFFAAIFVVASVGKIDAGAAGLAMTYAVTFTENVLWFVRLYASNEQNMNSVERVKEYLDVDQEAKAIVADNRPPANWPSNGAVEFINYSTRYRKDFDPVLKNITFRIAPGEKVGVVGRTGAGKSSLALALFRALEAEEGKILIDGVDIGLVGLQDLRESIVMVPQDPTLFSGTIRTNLDPFDLFTDDEIFAALRRVQLIDATTASPSITSRPATPVYPNNRSKATVMQTSLRPELRSALDDDTSPSTPSSTTHIATENKNIFRNLSSSVSESGLNLSQGQRQLLCLARALLKNPKVLVMDEATASIDFATDAKIQETIRNTKSGTIITIAHRLKTIIDYDKVLVLDRGTVVECGSPWELLRPIEGQDAGAGSKHHRWFRSMCDMSGELEILETEAKKSWERARLIDHD